jgi:glycosyl-4,4'-diaponeurosporenoate acyltransferase
MNTNAAAALLQSGLGWVGWSLLVGGLANQIPAGWLADELWLWQRPWGETCQGFERRLAIRRWKGWLPDAGAVLPQGVAKAALVGRTRPALERLVLETRRAELVHLLLWPFWVVTALWLPPSGVALNLLFACAFNLPCLWVQRYNRLRLARLLGVAPLKSETRPADQARDAP